MFVERIWTGNAYRNFNYLIVCPDSGEALAIDPKHRGAHEYLGEAYLVSGNLAKAKEHLGQLAKLCGACEEHGKLKQAIASFEALFR